MPDTFTLNGGPIPSRPSPNHAPRPAGVKPSLIVLHSTGGSYNSALNWMREPKSKVSAHFLISKGGVVVQLVDCDRAAWHAGKSAYNGHANCNAYSVGIEMEHVDGKDEWPDAQVKVCAELCRLLCSRFGIDRRDITSHAAIATPSGRKVDPLAFPWNLFRRYLAGEPRPHVSVGQTEIPARLIAGVLYAPARDLTVALKIPGEWDSRRQQFRLADTLPMDGVSDALISGTHVIPGRMIESRLYVPVRDTVTTLGASGVWDERNLAYRVNV